MKTIPDPVRSWLFAPGHDEKLLRKLFEVGADMVLLDLKDAVPDEIKDRAREMVVMAAEIQPCWVRVNRAQSEECKRDLEALAGKVLGVRIPKVESAADVEWVAKRAPGLPVVRTKSGDGRLSRDWGLEMSWQVIRADHEPRRGRRRAKSRRSRVLGG